MTGCKQELRLNIEESFAEQGARQLDYDAQAAGDCLASFSKLSLCGEVDEDEAPACEHIFRGRLAVGQPCNDSDECREGSGQQVTREPGRPDR